MNMPTPQAIRDEALRLRFEEKWALDDIARHVGRATSTVAGWCRRQALSQGQVQRYEPPRPPPDTRTPAQRLMGDPMPGRSALDQRRQA